MGTQPHPSLDNCSSSLSIRRIVHTWWPLAGSWLLMAVEIPVLSAFVARLADPTIHLAAFGGIVYPLALLIEAPILMLLSASTALSKDWRSYLWLRRFMTYSSAVLTAIYILITFTPLYHVVVARLIDAPAEVVEPARAGMMVMIPWVWAIAYRRFNQGILIRFGHSQAVGVGTLIRLAVDGIVMAVGFSFGTIPGALAASIALAAGVTCEAIYSGLRVQPVLRDQLRPAPPVDQPLTLPTFLNFYIPLAMTSLIYLVVQPLGSAAASRMPQALDSLAAWSVVSGYVFMLRSLGVAYNEVVIALLDEPRSTRNLRRFAAFLTAATTILLLITAIKPVAELWFGRVSGLEPSLVVLARWGLLLSAPLPGLNVLLSWYQGTVVHSRRTRGIIEATAIYLLASGVVLWAGVQWQQVTGLYVTAVAFVAGRAAQTAWMWYRSRPAMRAVRARDAADSPCLQKADAPAR